MLYDIFTMKIIEPASCVGNKDVSQINAICIRQEACGRAFNNVKFATKNTILSLQESVSETQKKNKHNINKGIDLSKPAFKTTDDYNKVCTLLK